MKTLWAEIFEEHLIGEIKAELTSASTVADRLYGGQERVALKKEVHAHLLVAKRRLDSLVKRLEETLP